MAVNQIRPDIKTNGGDTHTESTKTRVIWFDGTHSKGDRDGDMRGAVASPQGDGTRILFGQDIAVTPSLRWAPQQCTRSYESSML
jgi:hypothetical protein